MAEKRNNKSSNNTKDYRAETKRSSENCESRTKNSRNAKNQ